MTLAERFKRDARLVRRARRGDQAAKAELVAYYDDLAGREARKGWSPWLTHDDLIQEARLGLLDAVERWDPKRGTQFMTVAVIWCRNRVRMAVLALQSLRSGKAIKVFQNSGRAQRKLSLVLGRDPTQAEIAVELDVEEDTVKAVQAHCQPTVSLERPFQDSDFSLYEMLPDPTERVDERLEREGEDARLHAAVARLSPRPRYIVERRYLNESDERPTLVEIGGELGLSRERVRQLEARALRFLAFFLAEAA